MNKKALMILFVVGVLVLAAIIGYAAYRANTTSNQEADTNEAASEETTTEDESDDVTDEDVAEDEDSKTDDEADSEDEDADEEAGDEEASDKKDIDVSDAVESRQLQASFVRPSTWYWAGQEDGSLEFSNKANFDEINIENQPSDFQSFFLRRGNIDSAVKGAKVAKTIETYDGAEVSIYNIANEEGVGARTYAIWTSPDGDDYYGLTGGPSSDANVKVAAENMESVILTIQHL